jgi:hypothetical protein
MPWRWPVGVWLAGVLQLSLWFAAAPSLRDATIRRRGHGLIAGVLVCGPVLGTVVAGPLPLAPLLGLHLWESWLLLAVLAYVVAAGLVTSMVTQPSATRRVLSLVLLLALLVGPERHIIGVDRQVVYRWSAPTGQDADLARWLAAHGDGLLLVAPVGTTWLRPATGRGLFVTVKDGGEAVFDRDLALQWQRRLELLCGTDVLAGDPPRDQWRGYQAVGTAATAAFATQDTADLRQLAFDQRAWQLVVPASMARHDLDPVFATERYLVYDLRQTPRRPEEP